MARTCIPDKLCRCHVCGGEFYAKYRVAKYCGDECRNRAELNDWHRRRAAKGLPTLGHSVNCMTCSTELPGARGSQRYCDACRKVAEAEKYTRYRLLHPDAVKATQRKVDDRRRDDPARRANVRVSQNRRLAAVRATPRGNLDHRMGQLVRGGLRGKKRGRTWRTLVGYSLDDLMVHIERQFLKGMSWENMGEWHIDHIVPMAAFQYESPEDAEFKACWALTNLRPLWSGDNIRKNAKRIFLI